LIKVDSNFVEFKKFSKEPTALILMPY